MSRKVRSAVETRALKMLRALSASASIRSAMEACGYTEADHDEGWKLCLAIAGYSGAGPSAITTNEGAIRAAVARLTAFATRELPCLAAGVKRVHREHYEALFAGLSLTTTADAVLESSLFLERYDALAGKGAKKGGHAVVTFLEKRAFPPSLASALTKSVQLARSTPETVTSKETSPADKRDADLEALRAWVDDWSITARRAITRKDELHRMGIGRRAKKNARGGGDVVATPQPAPVAAPGTAGDGASTGANAATPVPTAVGGGAMNGAQHAA